jgi:uncharacterized protein YhjY with autotransporter beta-barrel domain
MRRSILLFLLWTIAGYSDANTLYTVNFVGFPNLYKVDLTNGNVSIVNTTGGSPNYVTLGSRTTAYIANDDDRVQRVNLTTGTVSVVCTIAGSEPDGIALANDTTAYVAGFADNNVYRVNLTNGGVTLVTPSAIIGAALTGLTLEMSLKDPTTAYTAGFSDNKIYRIDLTNGRVSEVVHITGVGGGVADITLANNTTAYVVGSANLYRVDLTNGSFSLVATLPLEGLSGIQLSDNTTAYVVGETLNEVYRVDLTNGQFSAVTSSISGGLLANLSLLLYIGTSGLSGNDLSFANYLNENGSLFVSRLFAVQSDIPGALEIAAPTRNALSTFAAGNTQFAFGQELSTHLTQKRPFRASVPIDRELSSADELLVSASDSVALSPNKKKEECHSTWLGLLGEYTHAKAQSQTPAFATGTGGFVAGFDWQKYDEKLALLGVAIAYGYTHVYERQNRGHASINQGAVGLYSAMKAGKGWFDLGLWGGMYHTSNERNINIPGIVGGTAKASINGWQLSPHLEFGYDYDRNWFRLEPFEMMDWVVCWERGFHEHGAGILNMGQKGRTCALLRNEVGLRFIEQISYMWGTLTLREKGSYGYQKTFNMGTITAFLLGSPGTFTVTTLSGAQNLGVAEFEALFTPKNKKYPYGSISCQGEFGAKYQSVQANLTIGKDF